MRTTTVSRAVGRLLVGVSLLVPVWAIGAMPAQAAEHSTTLLRVPVDDRLFLPCANGGAGEVVHFTGTISFLEQVTRDDAGGFHLQTLEVQQGVHGVGETTGAHYTSTFVNLANFNETSGSLPLTSTQVEVYRVNGPGGNDSLIRILSHTTINANGVITATVDESTAECLAQEP